MDNKVSSWIKTITFASLLFSSCVPIQKQKNSGFERIVVLGQAPLELLLRLGYKDKIVGIGYLDQIERLEEASSLPIMTIGWPDKESVLALEPDLIFALESAFRSNKTGARAFWEKRGIPTCVLDNYKVDKNLENLMADFTKAGQVLDTQQTTDSLVLENRALRQKYHKVYKHPKRVLHLSYTGTAGQYYYYPTTMCLIDEVITDCGGEYIDLGPNYFIMPLETIIQSAPDKIIITWFRKKHGLDLYDALQSDPILHHVSAIKNGEMLEIDYTQAIRGTYNMESIYQSVSNFLKP